MKVLLVEQHFNRGFESNLIIGEYLKEMGHDVQYSFTGLRMKSSFIKFKPDIVYMPWMSLEVYNFIKHKNPQTVIINSFQEQLVLIDNFTKEFQDRLLISDYYFAWGEEFENKIKECNLNINTCVVGAPRFDLYRNDILKRSLVESKEVLANRHGLAMNKRWILIVMDFSIFKYPKETLSLLIKNGTISEDYYEATKLSYNKLSEWLRKFLMDNRSKEYEVIIRPHPGENIKKIIEDQKISHHENVHYISEGHINKWIINCDKYVTRTSTSIFEAWLAKKDTVMFMTDMLPEKHSRYIQMRENKDIANSYNEFLNFILSEKRETNTDYERVLERLYWKLDGKSCLRTAEEINKIIGNINNDKDKVFNKSFLEDIITTLKANIVYLINKHKLYRIDFFNKYYTDEFITNRELKKIKAKINDAIKIARSV
jgi:surface carbohydrate biosynthesis protein